MRSKQKLDKQQISIVIQLPQTLISLFSNLLIWARTFDWFALRAGFIEILTCQSSQHAVYNAS